MVNRPENKGAARRFVINVVGVIGLVFGALPVLRYLFDSDLLNFSTAPYNWLALEGGARFLPPAMVLLAALAVAFWLERGAPEQ